MISPLSEAFNHIFWPFQWNKLFGFWQSYDWLLTVMWQFLTNQNVYLQSRDDVRPIRMFIYCHVMTFYQSKCLFTVMWWLSTNQNVYFLSRDNFRPIRMLESTKIFRLRNIWVEVVKSHIGSKSRVKTFEQNYQRISDNKFSFQTDNVTVWRR